MMRFLARALLFLASAALGLLIAGLVIPDVTIRPLGFVITVVIFAVLQSILAPAIAKFAENKSPALVGLTGIVSTFIALLISTLVSNGLTISGFSTWIFATLLVWLVTALATILLPSVMFKKTLRNSRS